jgi:hypothetical protein
MRILITGNPTKDITKSIYAIYPDAHTVSRSPEATYSMDLADQVEIHKLATISLDYDVFVNCALIPNFGQTRILQAVWTEWKANQHPGHIISFGSAVDYYYRPDNRLYPIEKRSLRDLNRSLSKHVVWFDSKIRTTYLSFGGVETDKTMRQWGHFKHHTPEEIAGYLQWVINTPDTVNIDELHMTPIQPMTKKEMKKNSTGAPVVWESGDTRSYLIAEE